MKSSSRQKITGGAVALALLAGLLQLGGEYVKMALNGDLPSPVPTMDQRPALATLARIQETDMAAQAQRLGVTLEPSAGALENLVQLRMAQATPQPNLLLTYCKNTTVGTLTPDQCQIWVDATIKDHAADIAYCQAQPAFNICLTEREIPPPA